MARRESPDTETIIPPDVQTQLRAVLDQLPHTVPLYLFTRGGTNEPYNEAAKQVIGAFARLSRNVQLKEYDLSHKLAEEWKVTLSPTILFDPERYDIRFLGAPIGEEGRTFLEAVVLIGLRKSNLSDQSLKLIKKIDARRKVRLF
jgi:thioredoxin reductase (NADPH)